MITIIKSKIVKTLLSNLSLILLTAMLYIFNSCGVKDQPLQNEILDMSNLEGSCKLDTKRLQKIFEEDVSIQINCLKDNLKQYTKYVRRDDQRYIQKDELQQFVEKFFPNDGTDNSKSIDMLFQFNSLIQGDPVGKITITKLDNIFKLLQILNNEGQKIFKIVKDIDDDNYHQQLPILNKNIETIITKTFSIINFKSTQFIDLNQFSTSSNKLKNLFFLKPLFFGGVREKIYINEVKYFLNKVTEITKSFYPLYYSIINLDNYSKVDIFKNVLNSIKTFENILYPVGDNYKISSVKDIITHLKKYFKDNQININIDLDKAYPAIVRLKNKFLKSDFKSQNDIGNLTFREVKELMNWIEDATSILYFNSISYDHFQKEIESPDAITNLSFTDLPEYKILDQRQIKKYWEKFLFILLRCRYFSDNNNYQIYDDQYHRTLNGINNLAIFKFAIEKAVHIYGKYYHFNNIKEMARIDVGKLFYDGEELIKEIGMWPEEFDKLIDKVIMGSDLFQTTSDGNSTANVDELGDFIITVMNASKLSNNVYKKLTEYCTIDDLANSSMIDLKCYRSHFYDILFNDLQLTKEFPLLKKFYDSNTKEYMQNYLINLEIYSRDNPNQDQPMSKGEFMGLLNAFCNVESAFYRFDFDHDRIIKYDEMNLTFSVFNQFLRNTDEALANMPDAFVKNILIFMLKKMRMPKGAEPLWFHLFGKKDDLVATRFNISAILRVVTEEGYP